jgi:thiamine-phosphate pyrophosphorylase
MVQRNDTIPAQNVTKFDLSLYLVLDPNLCRRYSMVQTTVAAIKGGVSVVQLRDKTVGTAGLVDTGLALKTAMAGSNVPLIVNNDLEAALALNADGLHVGQGDMDAYEARQKLGGGKILGLSVEDEAAVRTVDPAVVDYVGIGPVFATSTKPDHKPPIGLDGLARLVSMSPVPAVAIGGLKTAHIPAVQACGATGMAVVSAVCGQLDPQKATQQLVQAWASHITQLRT